MKACRVLFAIVLIFVLTGCSGIKPEKNAFISGEKYAVAIQFGESGAKGALTLLGSGDYELICEDDSSPLFGLKETVINGQYVSEYAGIQSKEESLPPMAHLLSATLAALENKTGSFEKEPAVLDNETCLVRKIMIESGEIVLWQSEETGLPVVLKANLEDKSLVIRFGGNQS